MQHRINYYLDGRLYEWTFSICSLTLGLSMMIYPTIANGTIVKVLLDLVGWPIVALVFIAVGAASIAALIINGNSYAVGPRVRSICAIFRSILWAQFVLSMIYVSQRQGFPSPMIFFFSVFTASEFYVIYRAVLDVRDR